VRVEGGGDADTRIELIKQGGSGGEGKREREKAVGSGRKKRRERKRNEGRKRQSPDAMALIFHATGHDLVSPLDMEFVMEPLDLHPLQHQPTCYSRDNSLPLHYDNFYVNTVYLWDEGQGFSHTLHKQTGIDIARKVPHDDGSVLRRAVVVVTEGPETSVF